MAGPAPFAPRRVGVVADDLIWATRLASAIKRAGGEPVAIGRPDGLARAAVVALLVDLGAQASTPWPCSRRRRRRACPSSRSAQHDDVALRKQALAAGAARVYSYNKFHADGPTLVGVWLAALPG